MTDVPASIPTGSFTLKGPYGRRAAGLSVAAAVGGFLFGFDSSVINGAVDSIAGHFELSEIVTGFVVAVALLGCSAARSERSSRATCRTGGGACGSCSSARSCSSSARSARP